MNTSMQFRVAVVAGALAFIGTVACGGGSTPDDPATHTTAATATPTGTATRTPATTAPASTPPVDGGAGLVMGQAAASAVAPKPATLAQQNAAASAADYLDSQAFSRKGLITQLKYEGFSTADATWGVDSLHADWKAQAAASAKDYLSSQSFSRKSLIAQLEYEGFTKDQAVYGVSKTGL